MAKTQRPKNKEHPHFIQGSLKPQDNPPAIVPEIAFWGRSNVGKSSILNALFDQPLARVAKTPGRTQSLNFYAYTPALRLVDLPGYGYAAVPLKLKNQWQHWVVEYLQNRPSLRHIYVLVDGRHPLPPIDREALTGLAQRGRDFSVVLTKGDTCSATTLARRYDEIANHCQKYWPLDKSFDKNPQPAQSAPLQMKHQHKSVQSFVIPATNLSQVLAANSLNQNTFSEESPGGEVECPEGPGELDPGHWVEGGASDEMQSGENILGKTGKLNHGAMDFQTSMTEPMAGSMQQSTQEGLPEAPRSFVFLPSVMGTPRIFVTSARKEWGFAPWIRALKQGFSVLS